MRKSTDYTLKTWIFGLLAFVAIFCSEFAMLSGTSDFLNQGLINWLPILLFVVSLGPLVRYAINSLLSKKLSINRSLIVTFFLLMLLIVPGFYLQTNLPIYLFISLLVARLAAVFFDTSTINLTKNYVNSRQAKSFLPLIRVVMNMAMLTASGLLFVSANFYWKINGLWMIIGALAMMIVLVMIIGILFEPVVEGGRRDLNKGILSKDRLKDSMQWVFKKSRFYNSVAWLFFFFGGAAILFIFVYNQTFVDNLQGTNLTKFIAAVNFVAVLARMVFDFAYLKKSIFRIGTGNLLLVYPWIMFLLTFLLSIWVGNLYLAAGLYIFQIFSYYSYVTAVNQSMFRLIPRNFKQRVCFLIRDVMPAVAALLTSLLMGLITYFTDESELFINVLLFLFVAASMILALRIKRLYQGALIIAITGKDDFLRGNAIELMDEKVQMERGEKVLRKIVIDQNEEITIREKALASLLEIGNPNSIRELLLILEKDNNVMLRYYAIQAIHKIFEKMDKRQFGRMDVTKLLMLDVFNKVYEEDLPLQIKLEVTRALMFFGFDILLDFYKRHFISSSEFVKASIIEALSVAEDRGLITLLEPYLESEDLGIRAAAIAGLWRFDEMRDRLMTKLLDIFGNKDPEYCLESLKLIGKLQIKKMDDYVLDLVAVQDKKVSVMAIITSINLGKIGGVKVLVRKLMKFIMMGDQEMIFYILMRFSMLTSKMKLKFLVELRALSSANFDQLKAYFRKSDYYYDLELANLFNS